MHRQHFQETYMQRIQRKMRSGYFNLHVTQMVITNAQTHKKTPQENDKVRRIIRELASKMMPPIFTSKWK